MDNLVLKINGVLNVSQKVKRRQQQNDKTKLKNNDEQRKSKN